MKPTLITLFALSVAVFADDTNRFQIITHINIDGSLGVMKLDRQTGKTWRYEDRVGPEIIISEEGQALRERLGEIIIPRVDNISNFNMEDVILIFQAVVKQNDHLQLQKHNPVPKPNSSSGENNAQSKTNKPRIQPRSNGGNIGTNSVPKIPGGIPGAGTGRSLPPGQPGIGVPGIPTNKPPIVPGTSPVPIPGGAIPTLPAGVFLGLPGGIGILPPIGRQTNSLPMIPGGLSGIPPPNINIDPVTGIPLGGSSTISTNTQPVAGKPHGGLHLNIIIIPVEKSVGPGRAARSGGVDPVTGLPMGGGLPGSGGLPGVGGGGLPGVGGGVPESIYGLDPTTVEVKGINSALQNLSAFSLLHILLNGLDYPVQCIIDRHGIFLMPIGHPFIFLNGKPAETKNKSRWVLVGDRGG